MGVKIKLIIFFILIFLFIGIVRAVDETSIALEQVNINIHDKQSILRGAKLFANTCMSCHTMKYLTNNSVADSAGITADKMPLNQKEWAYGIIPPDLSLEARVRSVDWIDTYLHAFYKDPSRPTGFNNLLVPNTVMPNMFVGMQGVQEKMADASLVKSVLGKTHYFNQLKLVQAGAQTPEEFDETTRDLVNFLVYASDPHVVERKKMGVFVLIYLAVFFVVVFALKKLIWKKMRKYQ